MIVRTRMRLALATFLLLSVTATASWAANVATITNAPVKFQINTVLTTTGRLDASLDNRTPSRRANDDVINATVSLSAPFCNCGVFHWVQVITDANKGTFNPPLQYAGKDVDSGTNPNPLPIIDPPSGGYTAGPAEDTLPWYLTLAEEGGSNPNIGRTIINADGSGTFQFIDSPNYGGFKFLSFFVGETGPKSFGVIHEFDWNYGSYSAGNATALTDKAESNAAAVGILNTALTNGGFAGWSATLGFNATVCPEPSSVILLCIAVSGILSQRRRRFAA